MKNAINIYDAKMRITGTNKRIKCFKVHVVGNNNEITHHSENLQSTSAVLKNINALKKVFGHEATFKVCDNTLEKTFFTAGIAGSKSK